MNSIRPAITLILLSPILTEVILGATPLSVFLSPGTFIFLALIGYGLPVLAIREFAVRYSFGLRGIFLLGIAYGIFNEALMAKTMIMQANLPIGTFDHYGYALGISWLWSLVIAVWHAFAAVLFPILFTHRLYPDASERPWLGRMAPSVIVAVLLVLGSANFLGVSEQGIQGAPVQLAVFLGIMAALAAGASIWKGSGIVASNQASAKTLFLGLSIFPALMLTSAIAAARPHPAAFLAYFAFLLWLYIRTMRTRGWLMTPNLLLFGVGAYIQSALMGMVIRGFIQRNFVQETLIVGTFAILILAIAARRLIRSVRA